MSEFPQDGNFTNQVPGEFFVETGTVYGLGQVGAFVPGVLCRPQNYVAPSG